MRRSEINTAIEEGIQFLDKRRWPLPPQAFWDLDYWMQADRETIREIPKRKIGWDVTGFGKNNYETRGLLLYTHTNGATMANGTIDQLYAQKTLIIGEGQVTPRHHHWKKMEDIINHGEGILEMQLNNVGEKDSIDKTSPVRVYLNNMWLTVRSGQTIGLLPGDRIRLDTNHYHMFWAKKGTGKVLAEEVSSFNDDENDNCFNPKLDRFSAIEEDERPRFLLCNELPGTEAFDKLVAQYA